ncbi:antirestriction protein ArdA [Pantoea sp. M_4]|uniref:antirestriction protein ArdA n=1 Tax=Pantoea sp. M_4 TaxID=2608037 RepID=UPI001231DBFB|nr:antirestriction protein ArdA [Pantoea sp. M_4]KAA5978596.1 antirestriction protein ArdA [Pantoea sp. M_4]
MSTTTTTPAVYVGTYHKYNCGSIFGKWFDLTEFEGREDFYEACQALHADEWDAEFMFQDWEGIPQALHADEWDAEFMFQDWEGIPSRFVSESAMDWDFIAAYKRAEEEGREAAFIAWAEYTGECDYDAFDDAYRGEAESEEDYAQEMVEGKGLLNEVPEPLRSYFDFEAYARDLFSSGYVFHDGHVFSN